MTAGPIEVMEAAAADGATPGGTLMGRISLTTGSNASDLELSRWGTRRIRWVLDSAGSVGKGTIGVAAKKAAVVLPLNPPVTGVLTLRVTADDAAAEGAAA